MPTNSKYAKKIGGWYAVAASVTGIITFLLVVMIAGVVFIGYHPLYIISDLAYIYNYGLYVGIAFALLLSFIIGRSAGNTIANDPTLWARTGLKTSFTVFALSVFIGVLVLNIRTYDPVSSQSLAYELGSWGMTYVFVFSMGLFPTVLMGYLYGKAVKWQITKSS